MPSTARRHSEKPRRALAFERFPQRAGFVGEGWPGNLVASEFARLRVARQQPLRRISQRLPRPVEPAAIGRDQAVTPRQAHRRREAARSRRGRQTGTDQFPSGNPAHIRSLPDVARPVIIARIRLPNPARQTIIT